MQPSANHVVIAAMPLVDSIHAPMAAPAVLKASLTAAGIPATALDLNIEVLLKIRSHPDRDKLQEFCKNQFRDDSISDEISKILFYCASKISNLNPTVIALSLLTYECQNFTLWLCAVLRQMCPGVRIVIGGPGIRHQVADLSDDFRHGIKRLGLVDDYVTGDGDRVLVEYVKGNLDYPGINSDIWTPISDLDQLPYPDWSDYNFFLYSRDFMPLVDAKGCVRNCEFCDVIEFWQKFQSRKAENVFAEMLYQINRYGMSNFDFRSSLSNGNLKEFKKLLSLMQEYNKTKLYRPEQISWNASFIVRSRSQHPESMWQQMGDTHATLSLGVESVVPHVRASLGKHFDNEDIDYHLDMATQYNVGIMLMIIVGYPTETMDDYEYTKQWFIERKKYNKTIKRLMLSPVVILPGTQLQRNIGNHNIMLLGKGLERWQTADISEAARRKHYAELKNLCTHELGFRIDAY